MGFAAFCQKGRFMLFSCLIPAFHSFAAGPPEKITLKLRNAPLETAFREIQQQTDYRFVYTDEELEGSKPVSLSVDNATLGEVLKIVFDEQPVYYTIEEKFIIIHRNPFHPQIGRVSISGTVLNETGDPIPGITIAVKDGKQAMPSTTDGTFAFENLDNNAVLVFSGVNVEPLEVSIRGHKKLIVSLKSKISSLGDVSVVLNTGYQAIPKERATGSFTRVSHELINRSVSTDILTRLDGVTSSVIFNKSNIQDETFNIRGRSTLLGAEAASPLIVVDNFPYEGDINNINPNDIESITILKDAAAASIWGARSGNGVIVLNTRKGRYGAHLNVQFNANFTSVGKPDLFYSRNFLNSSNYIGVEQFLFNQGYYDDKINNSTLWPGLSPAVELLAANRNAQLSDPELVAGLNALSARDVRNDFSKYVYQPALRQQYSISVTGGSHDISYALSAGYDQNRDNLIRNSYQRYTFSSMMAITPVKNLEIRTGILYTQSTTTLNNDFAAGSPATTYSGGESLYPYAHFMDQGGLPASIVKEYRTSYIDSMQASGYLDWHFRPLDEISLGSNQTRLQDLVLRIAASYGITPFLRVELNYQNERQVTVNENYEDPSTYSVRNLINQFSVRDPGTGEFTYPFPVGGILNTFSSDLSSNNLRGQLNFTKTVSGMHTIVAIAGAELREIKKAGRTDVYFGYNNEFGTAVSNLNYETYLPVNPSGYSLLPTQPSTPLSENINRFVSEYVNLSYTYHSRYTVSASGREDGANIFGVNTNQKITPLWSAGFAWDVNREKFYRVSWIPHLRLRATYGYNGNIYNASAYLTAQYGTSYITGMQSATVLSPPNPERRWERVKNINLGVDFAFVKNIFSGSIDFYQKQGLDLIEDAPLSPSTGFSSFKGNAASTNTRGIDLVLNSRNIDSRFKWFTNFLLTKIVDKVTAFDDRYLALSLASSTGGLVAVKGNPLFGMYGYKWAGLDPTNGDPQGISDNKISKDYYSLVNTSPDSLVLKGSARPTIFGSVRNTFSYGALTISANISFKMGYYFRRRSTSLNYSDVIVSPNNDYTKRWVTPGDESTTTVPSLTYPANFNRTNFYQYSELLLEKGDQIRLQDIRISYNIDKDIWRKMPFDNIQIYVYMSNLGLLWRANKSGLDPDFNDNTYFQSYPNPKSYAVGIRIN